MTHKKPTIAVVGAGPKGIAIATKAKVLRDLGIGDVNVVIVEGNAIAADWGGCAGWTDGAVRLGTSPMKDIGFPYQSVYGAAVDQSLYATSWPRYLMDTGHYADWIDRSMPQPHHRDWAAYLRWAFDQAQPEWVHAWLTDVSLGAAGLVLTTEQGGTIQQIEADGLVFTGPGRALDLAHITAGESEAILNGQNYWTKRINFADMHTGRIAVIGAGETAAAIVVSLIDRPHITVDVISRHGVLYTRGESYYENALYSHPEQWPQIAVEERQEFINRTDRGVFSVAAMHNVDQAENVRLVAGDVIKLDATGKQVAVTSRWLDEETTQRYDKVIVAVGFDPYQPLKLLSFSDQAQIQTVQAEIDYHLCLPQRSFPDVAQPVRIHVPMLAGFAQGPGFPNLSCLGRLSDRILSAYLPPN